MTWGCSSGGSSQLDVLTLPSPPHNPPQLLFIVIVIDSGLVFLVRSPSSTNNAVQTRVAEVWWEGGGIAGLAIVRPSV